MRKSRTKLPLIRGTRRTRLITLQTCQATKNVSCSASWELVRTSELLTVTCAVGECLWKTCFKIVATPQVKQSAGVTDTRVSAIRALNNTSLYNASHKVGVESSDLKWDKTETTRNQTEPWLHNASNNGNVHWWLDRIKWMSDCFLKRAVNDRIGCRITKNHYTTRSIEHVECWAQRRALSTFPEADQYIGTLLPSFSLSPSIYTVYIYISWQQTAGQKCQREIM